MEQHVIELKKTRECTVFELQLLVRNSYLSSTTVKYQMKVTETNSRLNITVCTSKWRWSIFDNKAMQLI